MFETHVWPIVSEKRITVIIGKTGSGKTTQIPQLILDREMAINKSENSNKNTKIIITQPRRIATTSVAKRVSEERGQLEYLEIDGQGSVGYQIKLERYAPSQSNSLYFVTTGIALEWMRSKNEYVTKADYTVVF